MLLLMLTATVVTALLCLALIPLARKVGLVDHPGERKVHEHSTPLTGGPALLITSGLMLLFLAQGNVFIQGLTAGGLLMFLMGLVDDYRPLPVSVRFLLQAIVCMAMIAYAGVRLDDFGPLIWDRVLSLGWLSIPITIFAAMGVINSFNMIDGMDGVGGTVFLVAAAGMAWFAAKAMQIEIFLLLLVAFSAVLGYLLLNARFPWNPRARVFMGDSGSMFLGFFLAWCFISLGSDNNETGARAFMPMTAVWLLALPLLDTTTSIWRRWRAGESAFDADQFHLHHAFLRAGFTVRQTWLIITCLAVLMAAAGFAFELAGSPDYFSFWCFFVVAFVFYRYMKQSWHLQRFVGRDFIYNDFDEPNEN
jgi:UDP-GlcNAc:undecaprenyl-phosphate GlcNAc-1-phosphate transferase